ncbi:proteinase B [Conglomerata obtusa]
MYKTPDVKEPHHEQQIYAENFKRTREFMGSEDKILANFFNGYIAKLSEETKKNIEKDDEVAIIEKDHEINVAKMIEFRQINVSRSYHVQPKNSPINIQNSAPWGISRISSGKYFSEDSTFKYPSSAGKGVDVYVIDSGIEIDHPEFHGSAQWGMNLVEGSIDTDEHGHGTHCAGTIAGRQMGIAKNANLIAVKVLDKHGTGKISRVILGVDYVIRSHNKKLESINEFSRDDFLDNELNKVIDNVDPITDDNRFINKLKDFLKLEQQKPKSVVNMSVGGLKSRALEFAVTYATRLGIHFSVAAGNDHEDACLFSPGSAKGAVTVGASTKDDKVAFFSNVGKCVDIYAPGMQIKSSWKNHTFKTASGTSMAAPHVSGAMALYLGERYYEPHDLRTQLLKDSFDVVLDDEEDEDMLDFWPIKYLFGDQSKYHKLVSIAHLNEFVQEKVHEKNKN